MNSISCSFLFARSNAILVALAAMLATVSFAGSINLRSLIPVLSVIHASFVSMIDERYSLEIILSGT